MKTGDINTSNNIAWDNSGNNNWARPATLNTYLNGTYYNGLNATAKSQIVAKDWSIGDVTYGNNDLADQINDENGTKWNGKVALVTMSEYLRSNNNKSSCGTFSLYNSNYSSCRNTNWMYINDSWWTLSPDADSAGNDVFAVGYGDFGSGIGGAGRMNDAVRPVVYLSSEVTLSGSGTQSDPYQIK